MNVHHWQFLVGCFLLLACEKSLPFPEATSSVLVANAIVSVDMPWQVQLTQSATLDETISFQTIHNGEVVIAIVRADFRRKNI